MPQSPALPTGAGRYAPSPSYDLHIGNLRTAVLAWLYARGSPKADLSLVVRVGEHLLDRGQRRSLRRPLRCGHTRQPTVDQFLVQGDGRVVPAGVRLERPLDQRRTVGVRLDHPHFTAQLVALADMMPCSSIPLGVPSMFSVAETSMTPASS